MTQFSFRGTLVRVLPGWMKPRPGLRNRIFRFLYAIAMLVDAGIEFAVEGLKARMPGLGTFTALPYLGRDRKILRGPNEPDLIFARRLIPFRDRHRTRGNPYTLMRQVKAALYPFNPLMRIVNNRGTWYTLNTDDTESTVKDAGNWNWDGLTVTGRSRAWLIIYSDATNGPFKQGPAWGAVGGPAWGAANGPAWGCFVTADQVATVKAIIEEWRSATALFVNVIIAFDPASFDPASLPNATGMPDGTWGHWSKNSAGTQVPSRLRTARYWDG